MSYTKKSVFYIAVAIALALSTEANAQLVYEPLNPNFSWYDSAYLLNLNSKRIDDFTVNPDSMLLLEQDSSVQLAAPIIVQHEDSLLVLPGRIGKFSPKISFQWYNKYATPIQGADSSFYLPNTDGYFYVSMIDSSESVLVLSEVFHFVLTDTTRLNSTDDVSVSENNNLLKIKFINEPYYGYQLAIYNYSGLKVFSCEINAVNTFANLRPLTRGLYFASIEKGNKRVVKKFIIG